MHPLCTPTYTIHTHENDTQNKRDLSTTRKPNQNAQNRKATSQHSIFNTTAWGSHPHASPEGPGTTFSDKYQGWPTAEPLGAAMRLTALRQPKDISEPKNFKQTSQKPDRSNDVYPQLLKKCNLVSPEAGKCDNVGKHATPHGGAVQEPRNYACPHHLLELTTPT